MNPIIRKIQKTLALAASAAGTPEGETAARMARRLMAAHGVREVDIGSADSSDTDTVSEHLLDVNSATWRAKLIWTLGEHLGIKALRGKRYVGEKRVTTMYCFASESDFEVLIYLDELCQRQINEAAADYKRRTWALRSELTSFRESAVRGLAAKLRAMREEEAAAPAGSEDAGTALVMRSKMERSTEAMRAAYPNTGTYQGGSRSHNAAGYEAGKRVSLHAGVGGRQQRLIR